MANKTAFYDRAIELENLNETYKNLKSGELCIIYGRRRLGKTALIKKFLDQIKGNPVYYFVNKTNKTELLQLLSDSIFDRTNERIILNDWNDFFDYLYQKSKNKKFVFVMDEFSRLKESSPDFLTKFQDYWDSKLSQSKIMFVAIGSSMSMMYDIFMDKTAPLYGRMTIKMRFQPFRYVDFRGMFKELSEKRKIELYSIFGGTPYFLWFVKKHAKKDLMEIISKLVLSRTAPLREEPLNFITMELKKETNYNSILYALASTDGSRSEIIAKSGVSQKDIDYYLNNLKDLLAIISEFRPLFYTRGKTKRNKKTDNFFNFWYKFIFPNLSLLELGNKTLLEKKISDALQIFIGFRFEDIIKELLILYNSKKIKNLDVNFDEMSSWWGRNAAGNPEEIDIIANNKTTRQLIVCEVKWASAPIGTKVVKDLDRKSKLINASGTLHYLIVSRSGFTRACISYMDEKNITHLNLEEVGNLFKKQINNPSYTLN